MTTKNPTPGLLTSEFWLTALVVVAATVLKLTSEISDEVWLGVVTGTSGIYSIGRAVVKR